MDALNELARQAASGHALTSDQAREAADRLASAQASDDAKARFLEALAAKGETGEEVAALAARFRELARDPGLDAWRAEAIDVCGTGGDRTGTFNISTASMFVLAAGGVKVFKHGNRSVTSRCGSSNLLEALGVGLTADAAVLARSMEELGFCFMFAPAFHPAFKAVAPVRQRLAAEGKRTVFNLLGPLINPARPARQLLGAYSGRIVPLLAEALRGLGLEAVLVVHCDLGPKGGMDELSVAGDNAMAGFGPFAFDPAKSRAPDFGLPEGPVEALRGGDVERNLALLDDLLEGRAPQALEDTVCLNAGAAFCLAGKTRSIENGIELARERLLGGATRQRIEQTKDFYRSL